MWIFGPSGARKSAIAQTIADLYFNSDHLAASFFFSRKSPRRDNPQHFITTITYQLSRSIPEIQAAVAKAVKDDPLLLSRSLDAQAHSLITRPLNQAILTTGRERLLESRPRLVIIDGLDKCGQPNDQRYILEILSTTSRHLTYPILFLVTSRPKQVIRDAFNQEPLRKPTTFLSLSDVYEADISRRKFNVIIQPYHFNRSDVAFRSTTIGTIFLIIPFSLVTTISSTTRAMRSF
jgi:hypothetical protein